MRILIYTVFSLLLSIPELSAQTDTLYINLRNGEVTKLAISNVSQLSFENVTSIIETPVNEFCVLGNRPNPFCETTEIQFKLPEEGQAIINIYDILGNKRYTSDFHCYPKGMNQFCWDGMDTDGRQVSNGYYVYEVIYKGIRQTRKMIVLR